MGIGKGKDCSIKDVPRISLFPKGRKETEDALAQQQKQIPMGICKARRLKRESFQPGGVKGEYSTEGKYVDLREPMSCSECLGENLR